MQKWKTEDTLMKGQTIYRTPNQSKADLKRNKFRNRGIMNSQRRKSFSKIKNREISPLHLTHSPSDAVNSQQSSGRGAVYRVGTLLRGTSE